MTFRNAYKNTHKCMNKLHEIIAYICGPHSLTMLSHDVTHIVYLDRSSNNDESKYFLYIHRTFQSHII